MAAPPTIAAVTGTTVFTSDLWNTKGPAALDAWMRNPPHAVLAQTVAQSIPHGLPTVVALDAVLVDNYNGAGTPQGSGYTAPASGVYLVSAVTNLAWGGGAGNAVGASLNLNNQTSWGAYYCATNPAPVRFQHPVSALIPMKAGDWVQLALFQNSGAAQPTGFVATGCRMSIRWIAL